MIRRHRDLWIALTCLALALVCLAFVSCAPVRCRQEPITMHWDDGTTSTMDLTICER